MHHPLDSTLRKYVFEAESSPLTLSRAFVTETKKTTISKLKKIIGEVKGKAIN
jgi:hypothetical protein